MKINTPKIMASFVLDDVGKPKKIESGKNKHYKLHISVKDAPEDTYAVTYFLHPTYYDPMREARNKDINFAEELTSYGDYEVQAKLRSRDFPLPLKRNLYDALMDTYAGTSEPEILQALRDIKEN